MLTCPPSRRPQRFLITFDEEGNLLPATVRVGQVRRVSSLSSPARSTDNSPALHSTPQAVDVVGQAGKPRTISGFQTHQTPVRLGQMERAELATEEFMSYSHVLEGCELLARLPFGKRRRRKEG